MALLFGYTVAQEGEDNSVEDAVFGTLLADDSQCRVISGVFALLVQAFLGLMVLLTLLYKLWREKPRRRFTVWFMDTSKQGFAMGLQHIVNLALAVIFSHGNTEAGECIWYIANYVITVFFGLLILIGYIRLNRCIVERHNCVILKSGEYGNPPNWKVWFVQMILWCLVCCAEKLITAAFVILPLRHFIDEMIARIEKPLLREPRIELVLVMVILPVLLNMFFAWICDNIIKEPLLIHFSSSPSRALSFTSGSSELQQRGDNSSSVLSSRLHSASIASSNSVDVSTGAHHSELVH